MKKKMRIVISIIAALGIILFIFYTQTSNIPTYVQNYVENKGWHAKKLISEREKINKTGREIMEEQELNITGIDFSKEQELYQERYRLKESCNRNKIDVVVFTDENKVLKGGYLVNTEMDPGIIPMQHYDKVCGTGN